ESVLARERELDGGELGLRVARAQRLEALLGLVLEMLEARPRRQVATRRRVGRAAHEEPSFHRRPASAYLRPGSQVIWKVGCGGLSPSRGPSAAAAAEGQHSNSARRCAIA